MKTTIIISLALLIAGLLSFYIFNVFIDRKFKSAEHTLDTNLPVYIIKGTGFVSIALLMMEMHASFQILIKLWGIYYISNELLLKEVMYFTVFLAIIIVAVFIAYNFALLGFGIVSKGKKLSLEMSNGNLESAVLFGFIFISFVLLAKSSIQPLLEYLIPFPATPLYR